MTGFFVRICREGNWQPIDIAEMTDAELDDYFATIGPDRAAAWAKALAKWIRENVKTVAL